MKILDCTLRDGGYYTNWDFDSGLVKTYIESFNLLPVDYLEIGYRSKPLKGYLGEYFYCPVYVMNELKSLSNKKLVIILNEKEVAHDDVVDLLSPCKGIIDLIRIAVDPKNFNRAIILAEAIKKLGFEVGFNVMYMSKWQQQKDFLQLLPEINGIADYFYMVDSYGGVYPDDVRKIYNLVRSRITVPIGFHGHNNLELALINTLTAIDCGVDIVDATVAGMGRGAGNLKMELLLTVLNSHAKVEFDFNPLSKVVDAFNKLQEEHKWGTNLPYMVSGANSLPQNEVMDWVGKRYYSFNSIIRALNNQSKGVQDNKHLPSFKADGSIYSKALIVGGGGSANQHSLAIKKYLEANPNAVVIHASSKNAMAYKCIPNKQVFCLVGNEGHRMEDVFSGNIPENAICVLPPFPRKMGTYIPSTLNNASYELKGNSFTDKFVDSHTAIALQTALELGVKEIEIVGYDGYSSSIVGTKEQELFLENEYLFKLFTNFTQLSLVSLTPTTYTTLSKLSIYAFLYEQ